MPLRLAGYFAFLVLLAAWFGVAGPAAASPRDAELSGLACGVCQSEGASLTGIGRAWAVRSNRLEPIGDRPLVGVRANVAYVSDGHGGGLPKVVLDYLDLYANGKLGNNVGAGIAAASSGGLVMLHRDFDARTFAEARYEGTADSTGRVRTARRDRSRPHRYPKRAGHDRRRHRTRYAHARHAPSRHRRRGVQQPHRLLIVLITEDAFRRSLLSIFCRCRLIPIFRVG